ncbi:MAG TPA: hypothetical protein VMZ91_11965 [Candidatus Paceibacterota bacterium]|nr:hypothetical protein [Candidatus Paceibacterota bacterium]
MSKGKLIIILKSGLKKEFDLEKTYSKRIKDSLMVFDKNYQKYFPIFLRGENIIFEVNLKEVKYYEEISGESK